MASRNAIRRTSIAFAMLTSLLAAPHAVRAEDAAARAAAANDPEYRAGYSSPTHGTPLAGDCSDKPYSAREEFTACQQQAAERKWGIAQSNARTPIRTAAAPRAE